MDLFGKPHLIEALTFAHKTVAIERKCELYLRLYELGTVPPLFILLEIKMKNPNFGLTTRNMLLMWK